MTGTPAVQGFAAHWRKDAVVLILGSMPGIASLQAEQYYAHPRNQFWPLLSELLGFDRHLPYRERLYSLRNAGIALWDVLDRCERPGSLDSAIAAHSAVPNDIAGLLRQLPRLQSILFNGASAQQYFERLIRLPPAVLTRVQRLRMPSTSPAHAALSWADKRAQWRVGLRAVLQRASCAAPIPDAHDPH